MKQSFTHITASAVQTARTRWISQISQPMSGLVDCFAPPAEREQLSD